ncbi:MULTISPECIES: M1 family metallopeptidase [Streptomyces]|uniref:Aminopeptidase N n=1 Tax=Streptomyces sviceus (strain ATCC 29083 / DSM 924 / JCM 4929 / NBRC 13980 / NCIMB 11184 / NRRL 5439 / UC 5370) TaxID=463191 RepID=D6XAV8_STRX2|nr:MULTISPECIES: M1 family metallopeptidase [Streptomyces]EFH28910.1 zinc metalloprotease membrane protein [Streptomyces sviceus ATCC 29083]MYT08846.1 M1 family peptidase [Streptomyces sp. SID5470]
MPLTPHTHAGPDHADRSGPDAPRRRTGRARRRRAAALLASAVSVCLLAASAPAEPLGVGDRLFPHLGNPGYDVASYDLSFHYPGSNTKPLTAVTTIDAWTTTELDRINLDFAHGEVRSVEVDGRPADFTGAGEDLVVTPDEPLPRGSWMRITVRHTSDPVSAADRDGGWVRTADGLAMANQADVAHLVFPCNDHPSDKAMFTIRITAPDGYTAVANGLPTGVDRFGRATTWTYRTRHPMATELAQVSIGRSTVLHREGPHGLPVRDVVPAKDRAALEPWLKKTPGQLAWMENKVGTYPFETYGLLMATADTGFELETQTLSLFEKDLFTEPAYPKWYVESIMVHELSHQWFGDSVSPRTWSDLWLNEGHATWYEALYAEEKAGRTLEARMKAAYSASDRWRAAGGPPAAPKPPKAGQKIGIFRANVYDGAALVLYALRQEIGHKSFESLERAWVQEHRDGTASTADFVHLASEISGRDLDGFLQGWLYGKKTPPMPGRPNWKAVAPAAAPVK